MSFEGTKTIADEIVRLEAAQAKGAIEYEEATIKYAYKPIAPRLRELHRQLNATGKGPLR